jgi:fermentation-respiration switch protein FrsA (DUF1100 family)
MPFIIIGSVLLFLLTAVLIISYVCYSMAFKRAKVEYTPLELVGRSKHDEHREISERMVSELDAIPHTELSVKSYDGLTLRARYYPGFEGEPLEIQCHGYRSHPVRDFSGGAIESIKRGRHLLLIYQRAHGRSEGRTITFGQKECRDLLLWTEYMLNRIGRETDVIYTGISMGGATVLSASALALPENVKVIIADCPCSDAKSIIKHVIKGMKIPPSLAYPFVRLGAIIFGGFDPNGSDASHAVKSAKIPILLIHGEDDGFVPPEMSKKIYENIPGKKRIELFPKARHGTSYLVDTERYMRTVDEFINEAGVY